MVSLKSETVPGWLFRAKFRDLPAQARLSAMAFRHFDRSFQTLLGQSDHALGHPDRAQPFPDQSHLEHSRGDQLCAKCEVFPSARLHFHRRKIVRVETACRVASRKRNEPVRPAARESFLHPGQHDVGIVTRAGMENTVFADGLVQQLAQLSVVRGDQKIGIVRRFQGLPGIAQLRK